MMDREEALKLVEERLDQKNLIKHCLAVEAVMKKLADHFNHDVEKWGLAGLLHDIDYNETMDDPQKHSKVGARMLEEMGVDSDIVYAVKVHNNVHGLPRKSLIDKALYASDPLTGLIVAGALVHPDKSLEVLDVEFVKNRYQESSFARGADRDAIASCEDMSLTLEKFFELALAGMKEISDELEL